ncbi:hypothetical protein ANO14919_048130 [Xylariales sp. No.14919]|nr:hypothetical protein ANO14919_048130 [Xylariales sp. No.14919]
MLAMTRLPSDSFLPSGGVDSFDHSLNNQPDSVISPLSLPHSTGQPYFNSPPSNYASSPSLLAASISGQFFPLEHSSLLAPTRGTTGSTITSPSMCATNPDIISRFSEQLSPQQVVALLQRREEHYRRLRESWQDERAHLEASRARAEEMFREERNLMDEERLIWAKQKTDLENEVWRWKQATREAEAETTKLSKLLKVTRHSEGKFPHTFDGSVYSAGGKDKQGKSFTAGMSGASTTVSRTPSDGVSPSSLPPGRATIPESNPFVPLDPRMQGISSKNIATRKDQERVPSIDINEVIPGLEGVRLKAPAIQKSTFSDEKPPSPIAASDNVSTSDLKKSSAESPPKVSPAVITQETLLAPEHHRLTMHAGHTPNHSMSFSNLATLDSTAGNTASSTGTSTPSINELKETGLDDAQNQSELATTANANHESRAVQGQCDDVVASEEVIFEPSDEDPALKGPLCLKNLPAADELFLRRLSDKLEEVKATDATPSALNETIASNPTEDSIGLKASLGPDDSANDSHKDTTLKDVEEEIPLKLRRSNNFGQPFGQIRRTSGS